MRILSEILICNSAPELCSIFAPSDSIIVNKPIIFLWNKSSSIVQVGESTVYGNNETCPEETNIITQ